MVIHWKGIFGFMLNRCLLSPYRSKCQKWHVYAFSQHFGSEWRFFLSLQNWQVVFPGCWKGVTYTFRWRWTQIRPFVAGDEPRSIHIQWARAAALSSFLMVVFVDDQPLKIQRFSATRMDQDQHIWESNIQPSNDEPRKQKLIQGNYKVGKIHKSYLCSTSPEVMAFAMGPRRRWHRMRWKCGFHIRTPRM